MGVDFLLHKVQLLTQVPVTTVDAYAHHKTKQQGKVQEEGKEEREFVNKCIERLRADKTSRDDKIIIASREPPTTNNEIPTTYVSSRLERLKTECSLYQMDENIRKLDASIETLASRKSQSTVTKQRLECTGFIRRKYHMTSNADTCRRIEHDLYNQTGPVLIARIIRDGPKPSSSPETIWRDLLSRVKKEDV